MAYETARFCTLPLPLKPRSYIQTVDERSAHRVDVQNEDVRLQIGGAANDVMEARTRARPTSCASKDYSLRPPPPRPTAYVLRIQDQRPTSTASKANGLRPPHPIPTSYVFRLQAQRPTSTDPNRRVHTSTWPPLRTRSTRDYTIAHARLAEEGNSGNDITAYDA